MNIFLSSPSPIESAQALDDRRLVKMVLETAQLLSGAVQLLSPQPAPCLYKLTHQNHPCAIWTRSAPENFTWLLQHGMALAREYTMRYGKRYRSEEIIILAGACSLPSHLPPETWPECHGLALEERALLPNVFGAYRLCLRRKWRGDAIAGRPPRWTSRNPPNWFQS